MELIRARYPIPARFLPQPSDMKVFLILLLSVAACAGLGNEGPHKASAIPKSFLITGIPEPSRAWVRNQIGIIAQDESGKTVTTYTGTVHFSSTDPLADLPPDYTFSPLDSGRIGVNGSRTFFSMTFKTAGTRTFTVNDLQNSAAAGSRTVTVGLARCADIPPPWQQPCRKPPLTLVVNQRAESIAVELLWNADAPPDVYVVAPNSSRCRYAYQAFSPPAADSARFAVGSFVRVRASTDWMVVDSTANAYVWRAAPDSARQLTVFPDTTAQGTWHVATSWAAPCEVAAP